MIRAISILFVLTGLAFNGRAQTNHFTSDGNDWAIEEIFENPANKTYYHFKINGDTLLQGLAYRKFYKIQTLVGLVREDTLGNIFYVDLTGQFYGNGPNQELELYKFGAEVGDSTVFWRSLDTLKIKYTVAGVDTLVAYGKLRRALFVVPTPQSFHSSVWMDGLGSPLMPLLPFMEVTEYAWAVLCFNQINYNGFVCISPTSEILESPGINIAPNPASGQVVFSCLHDGGPGLGRIRIFDAKGVLVNTLDAHRLRKIMLETGSMEEGLYVAEIECGTHRVRKKLMVCHGR